jgi:hypothetical protein
MHLLSGKFLLTSFALAATGLPILGSVEAAAVIRAKTIMAIQCIYGLQPNGCETIFTAGAARLGVLRLPDPYFETARFIGTNRWGDDVWDVKLTHNEATYVIAPPDADGKIRYVWRFQGAPNPGCDDSVAPNIPPRLYRLCK